MNPRYIVAMIMLIAFMLFYPWYMSKITHRQKEPPQIQQVEPPQYIGYQNVIKKEVVHKRIPFQTESFLLDFSKNDGSIRKVASEKHEVIGEPHPLAIINADDMSQISPFSFNLTIVKDNKPINISPTDFKTNIGRLKATFTGIYEEGIEVIREIQETDENVLHLSLKLKNLSESDITAYYTIGCASGISIDAPNDKALIEVLSFTNQRFYKEPFRRALSQLKERVGQTNWVSIRSRYFCVLLKPEGRPGSAVVYSNLEDDRGVVGLRSQILTLKPEGEYSENFKLYVGPINYENLKKIDPTATKIAELGMLHVISRMLLATLNWVYSWTKNYGIAIIFLSIFISIVLSPLSIKSAISMKKMQEIQPKMQEIREKHKDNPQKMNTELMETYKKHKVNPFGGCLPMLLQIPIFFALYQVLMRSVELRGAQFLWIKDLAGPDKAFRLPFSLPVIGEWLNMLPVFVIGAMYLQQTLTSTQTVTEPSQKMLVYIMPLILGFAFYSMPSGFILNFLTSTLVNSGIQILVTHKLQK